MTKKGHQIFGQEESAPPQRKSRAGELTAVYSRHCSWIWGGNRAQGRAYIEGRERKEEEGEEEEGERETKGGRKDKLPFRHFSFPTSSPDEC